MESNDHKSHLLQVELSDEGTIYIKSSCFVNDLNDTMENTFLSLQLTLN